MWLLATAAMGDPKIPAAGVRKPRALALAACIAALLSGAVAGHARAEDRVVIETGVVRTSDLDLATAHGAKVLLRRVTAKAVARSIAPIGAPLVTAEYARVFGQAPSVISSR